MAGCGGDTKESKSNRKLPDPEYIIKSPLDTNDYSYLELENGLKVLVISTCPHEDAMTNGKVNPKTGISTDVEEFNHKFIHIFDENNECVDADSANEDENWEPSLKRSKLTDDYQRKQKVPKVQPAWVSLCVGAGSLNDPENCKGIAHLCEHMICTYGSKKYPDCSYLNVVKKHGGYGNAFTTPKYTTYVFQLDLVTAGVGTLTNVMDVLADAITNPNISPESLKAEIETIDSEFTWRHYHDGRRIHTLFSSCFPKSHSLHKFGCGNQKTLDKPDIFQKICDWKTRHYAANYMTLVISARLPLENLEAMARKYFSSIPKSSKVFPRDEIIDKCRPLCRVKEFNRFYKVVPFEDVNLVSITWAIDDTKFAADFHTKPALYLERLFAEDSQILLFMKSKNWVNKISTYFCSDTGMEYYCSPFCLIINLTDLGVKEIFSVIQAVLSYLKMVSKKKPSEKLFNEIRKERADRFHYEQLLSNESAELSMHIQQIQEPKYILTSRTLVTDFDPDFIQEYIQNFTPWNMNVILVSKLHEVECTCEEEHYGTQFCAFEFLPKYLKSCENEKILPEVKDNPQQFENPFRAKNLICPVGNLPQLMVMRNDPKLFFKCTKTNLCSSGKVPQAECRIYISCPMVPNSPISTAFLSLFNDIMFDSIRTQIVQCVRARFLRVSLSSYSSCRRWILFHIKGPSCHMEELVKSFFASFKNFEKNLTETTFANHFDLFRRDLNNASLCPSFYSLEVLNYVINSTYEPSWQIKSLMDDSTFQDFKNFTSSLKKRMGIFGLLSGCVSEAQAGDMLAAIVSLNYRAPPLIPLNFYSRMMELPLGERCICFKAKTMDIRTSFVTNYYQFGSLGDMDRRHLDLLATILRPAAYYQLRKVERLSYIVSTHVKVNKTEGKNKPHGCGLEISVVAQSNRHSAGYIDERIDIFLAGFRKKMDNYDSFIHSNLFPSWLTKNKSYGPEQHKLMIQMYNKYLLSSGSDLRKLSVQVTGNSGNCNPVQAKETLNKINKYKPNKTGDSSTKNPGSDSVHNLEYDTPPDVDHINGYFVNDIEAFKDSMNILNLPAD